ncbi:MAG: M1 family metallopeptidase [Gemmatimonadetes bacterium]|nr:M1 family metallopeptidase [Gemmatimonadota bacterium]
MFAPLDLPEASLVRTAAGAPGPEYWQQEVDYNIRVALDAAEHRIAGTEAITYRNRSPHELTHLWLQVEQNLFTPESAGSRVHGTGRWSGAFSGGGMNFTRVELVQEGERATPRYVVDGTRMRIDLERPLRPRTGEARIEIDWSFVVPEYGADRMGRLRTQDGWVYELAQWYPRTYVYDDVNGWNPQPYLGQGEFYLEYGRFDVEITVPREFIVVATGELVNSESVLTTAQRERLARARRSEQTVRIVSADEVGKVETRPAGRGPLTWRFRAENVRDFAWAASPAFLWDAASWEDVLIMSAYPREGLGPDRDGSPGWEKATDFARHTVAFYSRMWYRYPYPVAINVGSIVGGMEYPMIVFCSVSSRGQGLFGVTDHEFGHTWFPMIVGNDERRWAWLDEGFNTFQNHYSNLAYYGAEAGRLQRTSPAYIARRMQSSIGDQPIMTHADDIRREGLGFLGYRKPGYGLILLRELILGPERFDEAFRTYVRRWAYKHPQPADFLRTMEDVSGQDLDWFWRGWFYSTELLDQAVDSVQVTDSATRVFLSNREGLVMPVSVTVELRDGTSVQERLSVEVWAWSDRYTLELAGGRPVARVVVDPAEMLPDVRRENNVWTPAATAGHTGSVPGG